MKAHVMMKGIACVSTWLAAISQLAVARAVEVNPFYFTGSSCGSIVMMIDLRYQYFII